MPFERPTLQEIVDRMISDLNSKITGATTFLRRSILRIFARVFAGAVHLLYSFLDYMKRQLFATTADADYLEVHGSEYGILRKPGAFSSGSGVATGTVGYTIAAGTILESASGNQYSILYDATIGIGGTVVISFQATQAGEASNESAGASLVFISPLNGINTTATVDSSGITGGIDAEDDAAYRERILLRKRQAPHAGAAFDYPAWCLEVPGVTRAWSFPLYQGIGTVGVAFVRDDDASIIPTNAQRLAVKNYILLHDDPATGVEVGAPVTVEPGLFMIELSELTMNFTIQLYPNTSAAQDSVIDRLTELLRASGGPGKTISISQIYEAISTAVSEVRSRVIFPTADTTASVHQVHVLGTVTFQEYT